MANDPITVDLTDPMGTGLLIVSHFFITLLDQFICTTSFGVTSCI